MRRRDWGDAVAAADAIRADEIALREAVDEAVDVCADPDDYPPARVLEARRFVAEHTDVVMEMQRRRQASADRVRAALASVGRMT